MSLCIGIVGLPNVGKSTLFQTITKKQVDCANYPFCTIEPNVGIVAVPDKRVDALYDLTKPPCAKASEDKSVKKIYATVEFVDIAGLVKGASQGEGLGNKFLANIKETDAILYVLRCFNNNKIINTQNKIDYIQEKEILQTELILKDLEVIEKRILSLQKEARSNNKQSIKELEVLSKAEKFLKQNKILFNLDWQEDEKIILKNYQFLTFKPSLYLLNGDAKEVSWPYLAIDILTEFEAVDFSPKERKEFGLSVESELDILIKKSYELLNLITFFTTGSDETRAWTLKRDSNAPQAGGAIHTDFEQYFIKAEVINWQDLIKSGGFAQARDKGLIRTEGKDYIVQDGDVIEIKSGK